MFGNMVNYISNIYQRKKNHYRISLHAELTDELKFKIMFLQLQHHTTGKGKWFMHGAKY